MTLLRAKTHLWTVEEYEELVRSGFLGRDPRVELIEGEIVEVPPMESPHRMGVTRANNLLAELFAKTHWIQVQCPMNVGERSQPEPDLALLSKSAGLPVKHPTTADLIIEVSDTSLAYDRADKGSVYAKAGLAEYWVVNVRKKQLEVYRDPGPDKKATFGYAYHQQQVLRAGQTVAPLFAPHVAVPVAGFF